ncbi:MAG TPA: HAMP domain-containing sensor histidine kinase [Tepidisphaeraceae bacterium]|nr:HAMP domain-containing sensor histidine kinase [Tepidisphaeraceae bacterium]
MRYAALYGNLESEETAEVADLRSRALRYRRSLRKCVRRLKRERAQRHRAAAISIQKDRTLATICHDLRTPLNAILGWAQVARCASPAIAECNEAFDGIENNVRAQAALIDDILDLARSASGELRIERGLVDLNDVATASLAVIRPVSAAKGVELHCQTSTTPALVLGDPKRLGQVIWNLLSNAVKFTPAGGRVRLDVETDDLGVRLRVSDTGLGVRLEFLSRIFEPFAQDCPEGARSPGVGLGLAIVHRLVELHAGRIEAASAGEGLGTTFTVCLPKNPTGCAGRGP